MKKAYDVCVNMNVPVHHIFNDTSSDFANGSIHLAFHPNKANKVIQSNMYAKLKTLESVKIPSTVERIDAHAFAHCPRLTQVSFEGKLPKIHPLAFTGCSLRNNKISVSSAITPAVNMAKNISTKI